MGPKMQPVDSSAIEMIGYDPVEPALTVRYRGGRSYLYPGVPEHLYRQLMNAESKGAFMNRYIKPNYPAA